VEAREQATTHFSTLASLRVEGKHSPVSCVELIPHEAFANKTRKRELDNANQWTM
jgi:hypothetical protein